LGGKETAVIGQRNALGEAANKSGPERDGY